uniref:SH3 domain-containing protein n=1 Tax=Parascaris equorum TaxID=6256 RepID=A0A914R8R0_PAREQ
MVFQTVQQSSDVPYGHRYDYVPTDVPPPAPTTQAPASGARLQQYEEPPSEALFFLRNFLYPFAAPVLLSSDPLSPPPHPLSSTGLTAVAIYDYQKQDDDEISFEPDDVITNIDQVLFVFVKGV